MIPIKHGEGNWYGDAELVAALEARGQIAFRYTEDVNGAVDRIAGVTNEAGNVLGLMPHPEHAVDPLLGPTGGVAVSRADRRGTRALPCRLDHGPPPRRRLEAPAYPPGRVRPAELSLCSRSRRDASSGRFCFAGRVGIGSR